MSKLLWSVSVLSVAVLLFAGCSQSTQVPESAAQTAPSGDAAYLLVEKPEHAQGVTEVRKNGNAAEEVIVEGRIGGSENPFVDGIAAFTIVDPAVPYCAADEGCPTPWDYCCNTDKLKESSALVKIVGVDGMPVSKDARELLGVKELSRIVVRGKAQRDAEGNLTVLAEKVHIAQE